MKQIKSMMATPADVVVTTPPARLKSIVRQIIGSKIWEQDQHKWSQIESLLAQIETLSK
ncbi:hypothetical protein [Chamaesiphon sp.]|uniref:hypothetical protein n=1 Tax=Chamaesiphon sp. TaxID=2814140 RepID=UPI003593E6C8